MWRNDYRFPGYYIAVTSIVPASSVFPILTDKLILLFWIFQYWVPRILNTRQKKNPEQ